VSTRPSDHTREQKIRALELAAEKKRRKLATKPGYDPHEEQSRAHLSDKRERFIFCGNSWGKTTFLINEVYAAVKGYNRWLDTYTKVPANVIVVLDSPEKIEKKFKPEWRKWFDFEEVEVKREGKQHDVRWVFPNGSIINFMTFDQDSQKFEGIDNIDFIAADEPFPKYIYTGLLRGTREKGSDPKILVVGTPLAAAWLRTDIYEPWSKGELKDVDVIRGNSHANKQNLREGYLEHFESRLSDKEKAVRIHGDFFDLSGLALAHLWKRDKHIVTAFEVDSSWPRLLVLDPHPRKNHIAILIAVSPDDEVYVIDEYASRAIPSRLAMELYERWGNHRIVDFISDSLGSSELTGGQGNLSLIAVLNQTWEEEECQDWRIRPTTYDEKLDENWIQMIQEFLVIPLEADNFGRKEPKLKVFSHCTGVIFDIENVGWLKYKNIDEMKPKLDMVQRDYLSCIKYSLAARPRYNMNRQRVIRQKPSPWSGAPNASQRPTAQRMKMRFARRQR
jgi:hypothetical protein